MGEGAAGRGQTRTLIIVDKIEDRRDCPGYGHDFLSHSANDEHRYIEVKCLAKLSDGYRLCNLRNVDMAYGNAERAKFRDADMRGCSLYKCEVSGADFPEIKRDHATDIPHFAFTQHQPRNRWAR